MKSNEKSSNNRKNWDSIKKYMKNNQSHYIFTSILIIIIGSAIAIRTSQFTNLLGAGDLTKTIKVLKVYVSRIPELSHLGRVIHL